MSLFTCSGPFRWSLLYKRKSLFAAIVIVVCFGLVVIQNSHVIQSSSSSSGPSAYLMGLSRGSFASSSSSSSLSSRFRGISVLDIPKNNQTLQSNSLTFDHVNSLESSNPGGITVSFNIKDIGAGQPFDDLSIQRRDKVRQMIQFSWNNYVKYAWGENEIKPVSLKPHHGSVFGSDKLGLTLVDAMDTLYIAGLKDEFNTARDWLESDFSLENLTFDLSVFETTIRYVGGLLTCFSFTGDKLFLEKADYVASKLLPAFETPTGIPFSLINIRTGFAKNYNWASSSSSILSEIGTLHLEFLYLSELTGNPVYKEKVEHIRDYLDKSTEKIGNGLYPNYIDPKTGKWGHHHTSIGALGDSFYEYLLKAWLQSGGEDITGRRMYDEALDAIIKNLLQKSAGGLSYFAEMKYERLEHKMDHLACFIGGTIALGARSLPLEEKTKFFDIAEQVTNTCHESYIRSAVGLGPDSFRFTAELEATTHKSDAHYFQRPELVESYFYLWRLTGDVKYREWAWEVVEALENHTKVAGGYSGLRNVYDVEGGKDDVEQSFFLAETLKYLYLIFSDDDFLPLNSWVFNTEAHPLPIKGANQAYPIYSF